jgi:hypothetical protein
MRSLSFSLSAEQKKQGLILLGLVLVYLLSRLLWLEQIPIFSDEAIHIAVAQNALGGDTTAGMAMSKWLTIQAYGVYFGLFPATLFSARLLIVVIGLINLLLIFKLARDMGEEPSFQRGFFAALTYVVSPFALFYDRLFVADQFQVFFLCLALLATFRLLRQRVLFRPANAVVLTLSLLFAVLFKLNGLFLVTAPWVLALLMPQPVQMRNRLLRLLPSYVAYAVLAIPFFLLRSGQDDASTFASSAWYWSILILPEANIPEMGQQFRGALGPGFLLLLAEVIPLLLLTSRDAAFRRRVWVCIGLTIAVLAPYIFGARYWYLRYLLTILPPFCMLVGVLMEGMLAFLKERYTCFSLAWARSVTLLLFLGFPTAYCGLLIALPEGYPCQEDFKQCFTAFTAGHGVREAAQFLGNAANLSSDDYIWVISPDGEDNMNQGLEVYRRELGRKVVRRIITAYRITVPVVQKLFPQGRPIYLAINGAKHPDFLKKDFEKKGFYLTLCWHASRPGGESEYRIYQVEKKL